MTGATGFLGGALVRRLGKRGAKVTASGRNRAAGEALTTLGVRFKAAELSDAGAVAALCRGQDVVIHAGALSLPWGRPKQFHTSNALGTEHVVEGCLKHGVKRLVYISSPSVYQTFGPQLNVSERVRLPEPINHYAASKLAGERAVRRAEALPHIILRPRALFGPGDRTIVPRLLARLEKGGLPVIGDEQTVTDLTYVSNAVDAVLLCLDAPDSVWDETYNISNGEPVKVWKLIRELARRLDLPPPRGHLPKTTAMRLAGALEQLYQWLPGYPEPPLTRYAVNVLSSSFTLDISKARDKLGYRPRVSVADGLTRYLSWYQEQP